MELQLNKLHLKQSAWSSVPPNLVGISAKTWKHQALPSFPTALTASNYLDCR